jgi:hypothetical protein
VLHRCVHKKSKKECVLLKMHSQLSLFVIFMLLIATAVLLYVGVSFVSAADTARYEASLRITTLADVVEKRITALLHNTQLVLGGVSEFMGANFDGLDLNLSSNVSFARCVSRLQSEGKSAPLFTTMAFAPIVPVAEISAFEARVRRANAPQFDSYAVTLSATLCSRYCTDFRNRYQCQIIRLAAMLWPGLCVARRC